LQWCAHWKKVMAWVLGAALVTVLAAVTLSLVITYRITNVAEQTTTTTTAGNYNMTTTMESTIATEGTTTTADDNRTTLATKGTTTTTTMSTTTENLPTNTTTAVSIAIQTGVVVLGGLDIDSDDIWSAEVFPPLPCSVPSLENGRMSHSLSLLGVALVVCGGEKFTYPFISSFNCSTWSPGADSWTYFSSTSRPDTILLLGGRDGRIPGHNSRTTGEEVPGGANFSLPHEVINSCGVEDNDTLVVIGGEGSVFVTRFDAMGSVLEELTPLPSNRSRLACGHYPTEEGKALLVAGGWPSLEHDSSVLTLLPSASSWTNLNPLPNFPFLAKAGYSMVGGRLWIVGGQGSDTYDPVGEVLEYHSSSDTWIVLGNIAMPRQSHAMVAVGPHNLPCFQIP